MRILVIDDSNVHLQAALQTLVGHDVTVCASHKEAKALLCHQHDEEKEDKLKEQYRAEGLGTHKVYKRAEEESRLPYWDVVLSDLQMPVVCHGKEEVMAVGWSLALFAAKQGAKYVAVVTDANHHVDAASAMLDAVNRHFFVIDGARVLMTNCVDRTEAGGKDWGKVLASLMSEDKEYYPG